MNQPYPDIEIYIMKADPSAILAWLGDVFDAVEVKTPQEWGLTFQGQQLEVFFDPKAEKNFASLWFKQNHTPWHTDLDCARAAHQSLGLEIRCQASGWAEEEGETDEGWVKLIRGEEKPFTWW